MRIERLKINGFGSFNRGIEIDFGDERLSLVIGRNEAGKSTIMSAMFGILFGFKDSALQRKFEPWEHYDEYSGEIELSAEDGGRWIIRRNFADNTAEILERQGEDFVSVFLGSANPRGHADDDIDYYRRLEKLVGFQDEAVFRGTVFVGQSAIETSINDQIRKLVTGSTSTDFKGVLHELHSRFSELTMENPWLTRSKSKPRKIEVLREGLDGDLGRLDHARTSFMLTLTLEQEVKKLEERQEQNKKQLESERAAFKQFERFLKLVRDRESARERFGEADKRRAKFVEMRDRMTAIEKEVKQGLAVFTRVGDEFPELVARLRSETGELEQTELLLDRDRDLLRNLKPRPNDKLGLLLALLGLMAGGMLIPVLSTAVGLAIGVAAGLGFFFVGRTLATGYKERKAELEQQVADRGAEVKRRRQAIEEIIARSHGVLGEGSPEKLLEDYRRFRSLTEERRELITGMKVLGDWAEIDATYQKTAEENLRCNGLMEIILADAPYLREMSEDQMAIARSMEELRRRSDELAEEIEVTAEVLTEARIKLARATADVDYDIPALEESVDQQGRQLKRLELERDALRVVIDTLEECVTEFQEGDLTKLSEEVSEIFRGITSNRYTRVTLSPNMEPMLTKYDNTHIQPSDLSQGTQDQLYFAMRVAIARHLSRKVKLPFFLDDPFVNFDQERLDVTKDMLDRLDDHQIVMVTCDRDYERWSDEILDLDSARAESMANPEASLKLEPRAL
ncbi:MAG: AAA family ATPase [Planctomycetes bacterium]|nr:AAA family ATPase [Planctomycetota bacterium]